MARGGRPCPGGRGRRLRWRGTRADAAARRGGPVCTGADTALLLRGAAARRDAGRGSAWLGSGFGLAPRPSKRGGRQRCPRQVARAPCSAAAGPDGVRWRGMLAHGAALTGRGDYTDAALTPAAARRRRRSWRRHWLGSQGWSRSLGARWRLIARSHDWSARLAAAGNSGGANFVACAGERLRLRRRGMLARGAARTGRPTDTGVAST